jgi:mitochondrial splicing suppressor protein 51
MNCRVCKEAAPLRCSRCKVVAYCGTECQKMDWKEHKTVCGKQEKQSETVGDARRSLMNKLAGGAKNSDPTQTISGASQNECLMFSKLPRKDVFFYLIDAYRLRVDDEYSFTGEARGIYSGDGDEAFYDFDAFLTLAKEKKLLPSWWNDEAEDELADISENLIPFALEKSDLSGMERYKSSPFISVELRMIAEVVYGSPVSSY